MEKNKPLILIIEDEQDIATLITDWLHEDFDCNVTYKGSVDEGMDIVRSGPVDLIISDIMMPNESGLELLDHLNNLEIKTPVILITGAAAKETVYQAWKKGAFEFIEKPLQRKKLAECIKAALTLDNDDSYKRIQVDIPLGIYEKVKRISSAGGSTPERFINSLIIESLEKM